jgi:hypothetical protein
MLIYLFGVYFIASNIAFLDPDNGQDQYNSGICYMRMTSGDMINTHLDSCDIAATRINQAVKELQIK